jgi:hypothetical protein
MLVHASSSFLELPCFELCLAKHKDIIDLNGAFDVSSKDLAFVPAIKDPASNLDSLSS